LTPDSNPNDHPVAVWWRRWAGAIALVLLVLAGIAGFLKLEATQSDTDRTANESAKTASKLADVVKRVGREGQVREEQFCQLVLSGYEDRVHRVNTTEEFLASPAGEEQTVFNEYIREVSLPQTIVEVNKEREGIPDLCWQYKEVQKGR
jgi:hypothetical protein